MDTDVGTGLWNVLAYSIDMCSSVSIDTAVVIYTSPVELQQYFAAETIKGTFKNINERSGHNIKKLFYFNINHNFINNYTNRILNEQI